MSTHDPSPTGEPLPDVPHGLDPGWYQDPGHARRHRYWDGERWRTQCEQLVEQGHTGSCPEDDPVAARAVEDEDDEDE